MDDVHRGQKNHGAYLRDCKVGRLSAVARRENVSETGSGCGKRCECEMKGYSEGCKGKSFRDVGSVVTIIYVLGFVVGAHTTS